MTTSPAWSLHRDERCLRGLKFVYEVHGRWCAACFAEALAAAHDGNVVAGVEDLGEVIVHRTLRPMAFEARWGLRPHEIELHQRVMASQELRARNHAAVEQAIARALAGCAHG